MGFVSSFFKLADVFSNLQTLTHSFLDSLDSLLFSDADFIVAGRYFKVAVHRYIVAVAFYIVAVGIFKVAVSIFKVAVGFFKVAVGIFKVTVRCFILAVRYSGRGVTNGYYLFIQLYEFV